MAMSESPCLINSDFEDEFVAVKVLDEEIEDGDEEVLPHLRLERLSNSPMEGADSEVKVEPPSQPESSASVQEDPSVAPKKKRKEYAKEDVYRFEDIIAEDTLEKVRVKMRVKSQQRKMEAPAVPTLDDVDLVNKYADEAMAKHKRGELFPLVCKICGYTSKSTVQKFVDHYRLVHGGMTPFHCSLCNKQLKSKFSLKCHVLRHAGKTRFRCARCLLGFDKLIGLRLHIEAKHEGMRYTCKYCPKQSAYSKNLLQHIREKHPTLVNRQPPPSTTPKLNRVAKDTDDMSQIEIQQMERQLMFGEPFVPRTVVMYPPTSGTLDATSGEDSDDHDRPEKELPIVKRGRGRPKKNGGTSNTRVIHIPPPGTKKSPRFILPKPNPSEGEASTSKSQVSNPSSIQQLSAAGHPANMTNTYDYGHQYEFLMAEEYVSGEEDDEDFPVMDTVELNQNNIEGMSLLAQIEVDGVQTDYPVFIDGLMIDEDV